jgi:hypothetical protein
MNHEHRNKPADFFTPSQALPYRGGGIARSISPLGETGKGVKSIRSEHLILSTLKLNLY